MLYDLFFVFSEMLVNTQDECTIGFMVERPSNTAEDEIVKEYEPAIMWNLDINQIFESFWLSGLIAAIYANDNVVKANLEVLKRLF